MTKAQLIEAFRNRARSLRSPEAVAHRREMLRQPHILKLSEFVEKLRIMEPNCKFPDFDPLDGGANADMLFLFEKPGPMASASGFISRDNDDPTAEATFCFMHQAGIPRERTVLWNVVPGWNDTIKVTIPELEAGVAFLKDLLHLLPHLRTTILVGRKAQRARSLVDTRHRILVTPHPSPLVRARYPAAWRTIPSIWAEAM